MPSWKQTLLSLLMSFLIRKLPKGELSQCVSSGSKCAGSLSEEHITSVRRQLQPVTAGCAASCLLVLCNSSPLRPSPSLLIVPEFVSSTLRYLIFSLFVCKCCKEKQRQKKFVLQYLSLVHHFCNYTHGWFLLALLNSFPLTFMLPNWAKCGKKFPGVLIVLGSDVQRIRVMCEQKWL